MKLIQTLVPFSLFQQRPNLMWLKAGDLGSFEQKVVTTPIRDCLASDGIRFTHSKQEPQWKAAYKEK